MTTVRFRDQMDHLPRGRMDRKTYFGICSVNDCHAAWKSRVHERTRLASNMLSHPLTTYGQTGQLRAVLERIQNSHDTSGPDEVLCIRPFANGCEYGVDVPIALCNSLTNSPPRSNVTRVSLPSSAFPSAAAPTSVMAFPVCRWDGMGGWVGVGISSVAHVPRCIIATISADPNDAV